MLSKMLVAEPIISVEIITPIVAYEKTVALAPFNCPSFTCRALANNKKHKIKSSTKEVKSKPVKNPRSGEIDCGLKPSIVFRAMPETTLISITPTVVGKCSHLWLI